MAIDGSTDGRRDGRDVHTKRKRGFVTPEIQLRWGLTKPRRCEAVVLIDFLGLDTGHARTHGGGKTEKKLIDKRSSGEKRLGQTCRRPPAWGRFRRSDGRITDGKANSAAQHDARSGGNMAHNLENMERS